MTYKIVIIGAGQLGSRHLQALLKTNLPLEIEVVDPYIASLEMAKGRAAEMPENSNIKSIKYFLSIDDISNCVDLCVVATTALVRFAIIKKLAINTHVKNLILEKVLFQRIEDYYAANEILKNHQINCWVNCPRRSFSVYQEIKSHISPNEKITFTLTGGDWGLASNAIHFIDLLSFLNENAEFVFEKSGITDVEEGKRGGYLEFFGTLLGRQSNGSDILLHSRKSSNAKLDIKIFSEKYRWNVDEARGELITSSADNQWQDIASMFRVPYQSELTNIVCEDILTKGKSDLPDFSTSMLLHLAMLKTFQEIFTEKSNISDLCPIT